MKRATLRVVASPAPSARDTSSWRTDMADLDHRYRAKRSGQSPMEYAASVEVYRRPPSRASRIAAVLAVLLLAATALMATS